MKSIDASIKYHNECVVKLFAVAEITEDILMPLYSPAHLYNLFLSSFSKLYNVLSIHVLLI